jgi:hypothetical protein
MLGLKNLRRAMITDLKWNKSEMELPPIGGMYLVSNGVRVFVAEYFSASREWVLPRSHATLPDVKHWAHLPEVPKS